MEGVRIGWDMLGGDLWDMPAVVMPHVDNTTHTPCQYSKRHTGQKVEGTLAASGIGGSICTYWMDCALTLLGSFMESRYFGEFKNIMLLDLFQPKTSTISTRALI